ncbi:hypothetical protein K3495_g4259 [Podosphaera aphanis]|nr:hypothetical protein K3495_g4259 [Podosphaera aphanis]
MIRLDSQHEVCRAEPFLLRQQVQRLIPDPSLVVDAWQVPSGIAILVPTLAKAGSILEHKDAIAARFGNVTVERQKTWSTFVVGPIPKKIVNMEGAVDPVEGLLQSKPAISATRDAMPICHLAWTRRSIESANPDGFIRTHVPEAKAHKFPSRMQLSTFAGAKCEIAPELHTTSDHKTSISTIPLQVDSNKCTRGRLKYRSINENIFKALLGVRQDLPTIQTTADIETEAEDITQTIHTALQAACPRTKGTCERGTGGMKSAEQRYKRELRNAVRRAKRSHWETKIENSESLKDVFKIVNWHNTAPLFQTPPFKGAEGIADVQCLEQKASLLHRVLLPRHTEASDIPPEKPTVEIRSIPWGPFTEKEAFEATCQATSSPPGIDEITTPIPRLSWPIMGQRISNMFNKCAELSFHPCVFKDAEVIILPNSGKRDPARAVLPVYKTTPAPVLLRETGWGPATAWLERIHDRLVLRAAAADRKHPLRIRFNSPYFRWIRRRQPLELSLDSSAPPWCRIDRTIAKAKIGAIGRRDGILEHQKWMASGEVGILDLLVYSDGSLDEEENAGAGHCIYRGPTSEIARGKVPLGRTAEVYVLLDNEEAALRLQIWHWTSSSSRKIAEFQALRDNWLQRVRISGIPAGTFSVRWIPCHAGIPGNERADAGRRQLATNPAGALKSQFLEQRGFSTNDMKPAYRVTGIKMLLRGISFSELR